MVKQQNFVIFLTITLLFCFNLSHAQELPAAVSDTLGSVKSALEKPPIGNNPSTDPTRAGKYEEYQSFCRDNQYDRTQYFSDSLKEKRIAFLKQKVTTAKEGDLKVQLRLLKEYLDQGDLKDFDLAVDEMRQKKIADQDSQFINALVEVRQKKWPSAEKSLNELLLKDMKDGVPKNLDYATTLAELYLKIDNYYEASSLYEDLNRWTKNDYLAEECEALVLNSLNSDGEKVCKKAYTQFKTNPFPHIFTGISFRERGDNDKALYHFTKSLEVKNTEMANTCMGEVYFLKEDYTKASEYFKKSQEIQPQSARAFLGLGWSQLKLKNYSDSAAAFKSACKLNRATVSQLRKAYIDLSKLKITEAALFLKASESCD